jgi:hypothetical protein
VAPARSLAAAPVASERAIDLPEPPAEAVENAPPAATAPKTARVASEPAIDQAKLPEPPAEVVKSAPPAAAAPKTARIALRAAPREAPPALPRSSLPPDAARSTRVSVTPSQSTGSRDSLPTARFPTSAAN